MPRSIATPPHASTIPATAKLFEAMICDGPSVPPGATSSSPVARIATRARRADREVDMVGRGGERDVARA